MAAHFPPFTKPVDAYDSARLYRETSEIAAAQDAKLDRPDPVNAPAHYALAGGGALDVIEAVAATISDPVQATLTSHAIKYLLRWPRKGGVTDLLKCRWYLARLIGKVESANREAALAELARESQKLGLYEDNAYLASFGPNVWRDETLRESGIGDVSNVHGQTPKVGNIVPKRHPMAAEADRLKPGDLL